MQLSLLAVGLTIPSVVLSTGPRYHKRASNSSTLQWLGVNESGAEFGNTAIPGQLGKDYTWPNNSAIDILISKNMNIFRIPILMERLAPTTMTATFNTTYLSGLSDTVSHITTSGGYAIIDAHNFGRYNGAVFTSTDDHKTFWGNVANEFKDDEKVVFDCNNEFHDEPSNQLVVDLNQACIDGVRGAGATSQFVFVEGTSFTGAWTWLSSGNADVMGNLTDPSNKIIYEMHQYLDTDGSGTHAECVNSTIGAERVASATTWLRDNNKLGILGEFAGGNNSVCETAVKGMLDSLVQNNDVWMGALWWGGGPFWGDYIFSMEPEAGNGFVAYVDTLQQYAPGLGTVSVGGGRNATKSTITESGDKANGTVGGNGTAFSSLVPVTGGAGKLMGLKMGVGLGVLSPLISVLSLLM